MNIGDKVKTIKDITYEGGVLYKGTEGTVSGMGDLDGVPTIAFFVEDMFQAFMIRADSVELV